MAICNPQGPSFQTTLKDYSLEKYAEEVQPAEKLPTKDD
jgi:hypothetical protein